MLRSIPCSALLIALFAACSGNTMEGPPRTGGALIAANEGGSVTLESVELSIPGMALASDTEVTLGQVAATELPELPGAMPEIVVIEPEGTILEQPATLSISIDAPTPAGSTISVAQLITADGERIWTTLDQNPTLESGRLSVSIDRFFPLAVVVTEPVQNQPEAGSIDGLLLWGPDYPAADVPVELRRDGTTLTETTTNDSGLFQFGDLEPGEYRIFIDYECMLDQAVTVVAGEPTEVTAYLCGSPS